MEVEQKIGVTVLHVDVVLQTYAPFPSLQPLLLARFQCYDPHTHARTHAQLCREAVMRTLQPLLCCLASAQKRLPPDRFPIRGTVQCSGDSADSRVRGDAGTGPKLNIVPSFKRTP